MVMDVAACRRLEAQDQLVPAADHLGEPVGLTCQGDNDRFSAANKLPSSKLTSGSPSTLTARGRKNCRT